MEQASISIARTKDADVLVLARGRQQAAIAVPRQVGEQASVHGRQLEQLGASGLDVEDLDGLVGGARDHDAARQRMPIGRDQTLVARLHADGRLVSNKKASRATMGESRWLHDRDRVSHTRARECRLVEREQERSSYTSLMSCVRPSTGTVKMARPPSLAAASRSSSL